MKDEQLQMNILITNNLWDEEQDNDHFFVFPLNEHVVAKR